MSTRKNGEIQSLDNYAEPCDLRTKSGLTLHGFVSTHGVANFLNVPYALFPARFRTAQLLDLAVLTGDRDASQYGPRCPQPDDPVHWLMRHMFEKMPMPQYTEEFSCLDLNIYVPPEALVGRGGKGGGKGEGEASEGRDRTPGHKEGLPVFAWIHGGSFNCGDNTTEFDGNHLVARSMRLGQPIVVVTVNYRLNVLGFLTSAELDAEARAAGETPVRNQGLNDQRLALMWIRRHIGHFGGDGKQVTVAGESAGAASIHYLLKSRPQAGDEDEDGALFSCALICSAPRPVLRPQSDGQALFDRLVAAVGVRADAPSPTKLAVLRSREAQELIALVPASILGVSFPYADPAWFVEGSGSSSSSSSSSDMPDISYWAKLPAWFRRVAVGHTADEAALFFAQASMAAGVLTEAEGRQHVQRAVCSGDAAMAAVLWNLEPLRDAASPLRRLVRLATNTMMVVPARTFAQAVIDTSDTDDTRETQVYMYSIDIADPFPGRGLDGSSPGPLHGFSWHSFGNALIFYQPACQADAQLAATADRVSEALVGLIYGAEAPAGWQPLAAAAGRKMSWNGTDSGMVSAGPASDAVAEALRAEGNNPEWNRAYATFCVDPARIMGLMG